MSATSTKASKQEIDLSVNTAMAKRWNELWHKDKIAKSIKELKSI